MLDVYDQDAFLLPPVDPKLVIDVPSSVESDRPAPPGPTYTATFTIADVKGQTLPAAPNPRLYKGNDQRVQYDTRTQVFRLGDTRVPRGFTYTVTAPTPPDAKELAAAPVAPALIRTTFTELPAPPPGVVAVLAQAPDDQRLRPAPVRSPVPLRPRRRRRCRQARRHSPGQGRRHARRRRGHAVRDHRGGGDARPLGRHSRPHGLRLLRRRPTKADGEANGPAEVSFRPKHGAAWLETYFEGHGWVPIIGTPPRAKASLSNEQKNNDPRVVPTDELAVTVYVPVRAQSVRLLYELVRYWLKVVLPILLGVVVLVVGYPAGIKLLRSRRRRRWGRDHGPLPRIVVAYSEFRDRAYDFNVGDVSWTPLEFRAAVDDDDEHTELAWLVTRAVWGDLGRDLRIEDVEAAEDMARSMTKRLSAEQTGLNRILGWVSRTSLRDPYSDEIPNLWPRRRRRHRLRSLRRRLRFRGARRLAPATLAVLALAMAVTPGCSRSQVASADVPVSLPADLVPDTIGDLRIQREKKLESEYAEVGRDALVSGGRVFTIRDSDDAIQGTFQAAVFKKQYDSTNRKVQNGVEEGIGSGRFETNHYGLVRLRVLELAEQKVYMWFPPDRNVMELWVMRKSFDSADSVVRAMIDHQRTAKS